MSQKYEISLHVITKYLVLLSAEYNMAAWTTLHHCSYHVTKILPLILCNNSSVNNIMIKFLLILENQQPLIIQSSTDIDFEVPVSDGRL